MYAQLLKLIFIFDYINDESKLTNGSCYSIPLPINSFSISLPFRPGKRDLIGE